MHVTSEKTALNNHDCFRVWKTNMSLLKKLQKDWLILSICIWRSKIFRELFFWEPFFRGLCIFPLHKQNCERGRVESWLSSLVLVFDLDAEDNHIECSRRIFSLIKLVQKHSPRGREESYDKVDELVNVNVTIVIMKQNQEML